MLADINNVCRWARTSELSPRKLSKPAIFHLLVVPTRWIRLRSVAIKSLMSAKSLKRPLIKDVVGHYVWISTRKYSEQVGEERVSRT